MTSSTILLITICNLVKKMKVYRNVYYRDKIKKLYKLYLLCKENEKMQIEARSRSCWVRPIFTVERRASQGASNNLIKKMEYGDCFKFIDFFRLTPILFNELLALLVPSIEKQHVVRDPISAETRLHITLRYLASGDSMKSLSYIFRVSHNTVSIIVKEVSRQLWNVLQPKVFPADNEEQWKIIATEFEDIWNFPNCLGAIDGKHVVIQSPPNSGSTYYNYKGCHSINLLALCDANYCFTVVDIGAEGRHSDGGVFCNSEMGQRFNNNLFNTPPSRTLESGCPSLPYVIVADEAFPLTTYMMRPYPRSGQLNIKRKVFNYRLSRARRVVESAFGILTSRWRIFRQPIIASVESVKEFVKATIVLHNYIIKNEEKLTHQNMYIRVSSEASNNGMYNNEEALTDCNNINAIGIREEFASYFEGAGALPHQWEKATLNDF